MRNGPLIWTHAQEPALAVPEGRPVGRVFADHTHTRLPFWAWLFKDELSDGYDDHIRTTSAQITAGSVTKTVDGMQTDSTATRLQAPAPGITNNFSMMARVRRISSIGSNFVFGATDDSDYSYGLYYKHTTSEWFVFVKTGTGYAVNLGTICGDLETIALTYDGSQLRGFCSGQFKGNDTSPSGAVTDRTIRFNDWIFTRQVQTEYEFAYLWDMCLSDEEIADISADPYQFFLPVGGPLLIPVAAPSTVAPKYHHLRHNIG